jgi:hypothetical protein
MLLFFSIHCWALMTILFFTSSFKDTVDTGTKPRTVVSWTVEKTSTLKVAGRSNVNEFFCDINGYYKPDTIHCSSSGNEGQARLSGSLELDVFKFNCHSRLITNDLRKTLQANTYPRMTIRFLSLEHVPDFQSDVQCMNGSVEVEIAGVVKKFMIPYEYYKTSSSVFLLNGTKTICFSDFNLKPPRKLAGMIQIKDEFVVDFRLVLRAIK